MSRYKNGNPKHTSRFICLKCMNENMLASGIQRQRQRERKHITGLRESELAGLDLSDLHLDDEEMLYITILGKGRYREAESRTVYLTHGAYKAIRKWLEYRKTIDNIVDSEAVFVNKNGKRTTEDNIKAIFKNYGNGITPHMMRHWYASIVASKGNLAFAQQQLGHTSMMTTINNYANGSVGMKDVLESM